MKHFLTYVKHSYQVILEAEARTHINLEEEIEAFVVHTFAKYMEKPNIPTDAIAIKMLTTVNEIGDIRKNHFQEIAEECLLIDGLKLNTRRWPSKSYFKDMGILALENRAYSDRPPELMYERIANQFDKMSYVLNNLRTPLGPV
jgi:hypothetical protein